MTPCYIYYNNIACFLEEIPCVNSGLESCSRLLASFKISMISVANSRALNRANFCLPWWQKKNQCIQIKIPPLLKEDFSKLFENSYKWHSVFTRYQCDPLTKSIRASHRYCEVTGSNPVEVLNFSGFYIHNCIHNCKDHTVAHFISHPQFNLWNISYITSQSKFNNN